MTYSETIDFLYTSLPQFQRIGAAAYKANLDNTLAIDKHLNYPHHSFKTVHVAGTNGKGSTSAMLYAVLRRAGYRVGLYTSPHLKDFRERIIVDDCMIAEQAVISFVESNKGIIDELRPSFFEMTVAMAFDYFRSCCVDIAVVEVGMGGRLDSTNIITPLVSVITNIDYDHMQFLGNTLAAIAAEKGGIIKPSVPVVVGESNPDTDAVFIDISKAQQTSLTFADKYAPTVNPSCIELPLKGDYQSKNLQTVLATLDIISPLLNLTPTHIIEGLKNTSIRGRWETISISPLTICDTAHNPAGIRYVVEQLSSLSYKKLYFVLGMVGDKDVSTVISILPRDAHYIFTQASIPRAMPAVELAKIASAAGLTGDVIPSVKKAVKAARQMATTQDMIFIGGSTFTVADAL